MRRCQNLLRLLIDENLGATVVKGLRKLGFDVQSVAEEMRGARDEEVAQRAIEHRKIIVTKDKDFGRLALAYRVPGVLLVRITTRQEELLEAIKTVLSESLYGHITVLEEKRIRRRKI